MYFNINILVIFSLALTENHNIDCHKTDEISLTKI